MNPIADGTKGAAAPSPSTGANAAEVFQQVGSITRHLHDTLAELGVMPRLQQAVEGLPDARHRLNYIADQTASAAGKVLDAVDKAKAERAAADTRTQSLARALAEDPARALASGAVQAYLAETSAAGTRVDGHLSDIMLAQDFQDLTGQVVDKVVGLATELEESLLRLLVQVVPAEHVHKVEQVVMHGPVVNGGGRTDIVRSQAEVDELLSSLGF